MSSSKYYLVARREFLENVRTKAFWISILSFPIIIGLAVGVPALLMKTKEARTYAVLDQSGFLFEAVDQRVFAEDLPKLFKAAERLSGDSQSPGAMQRLADVLSGLDDGARRNFTNLAAQAEPDSQALEQLPARARAWLTNHAGDLKSWWHSAPDEEFAQMDLSLSRERFRRIDVPESDDPRADLNLMIDGGNLFAYFVIGDDPIGSAEGCEYVSNNLTDRDLINWYSSRASDIVRARRIARENIDPETAGWIQKSLRFASQKVGEEGAVEEVEIKDTARQWAPVAFVYALWIAIFTSAQMLLNNMLEEKSNRILEVLLSSVSAVELMGGKIAGMAASGLTIVVMWALSLVSIVVVVPTALGLAAGPLGFVGKIAADPHYLVSFLVYFVMGYLFYATLLAGIGSVCNSIRETQNLMMPIIIPMIIPLLSMIPIAKDPNSTLAKVMSFLPPFTPFVMMNRAAGPPEVWEYVLTTLLMFGAIVLTLRGTAKVFRIGILMTGKPPRLMEIVRWFALREGATPSQGEET